MSKDIILLYFYYYWVNEKLNKRYEGEYNKFIDELNDVLFDCGFSTLYLGNPYDWLFMYCSACADEDYSPLDRFREIMAQENE